MDDRAIVGINCWVEATEGVRTATVEIVGRKYITVAQGPFKIKFDKDTLSEADYYGHPRRLWFSIDEYNKHCIANRLRVEIRKKLSGFVLERLNLTQLEQIDAILQKGQT